MIEEYLERLFTWETLEDLEREGLAERDADGRYSVAGPARVLQKRQNDLWNVLRNAF